MGRGARRSRIKMYEVINAKTGSSVNRIAAWLGVVAIQSRKQKKKGPTQRAGPFG